MGISPAAIRTNNASLTHLGQIFYKKTGLDALMKKTIFSVVGEPDVVPLREGKTIQWYRYDLLATNINPSSEGTVDEPIEQSTETISGTISEYSDFTNISALADETMIDDGVANAVKSLSYRAGLSTDTIIRTELDTATAIAVQGGSAVAADLREMKARLEGADVDPKNGEDYFCILHPYILYDLMSDNTAGGFIDRVKYAQPTAFLTGEVGKIEGIRIMKSTNVNTSGTAPDVLYSAYLVGLGAIGIVDLAGRGPKKIKNPKKEMFNIKIVRNKGDQLSDPTGMIAAAIAYRFVFLAKLLGGNGDARFRIKAFNASII